MLTKEEFNQDTFQIIKALRPSISDAEAQKVITKMAQDGLGKPEGELNRMNVEHLKEVQERLKVFCLSKRNDSILMWSHYADNHRGVCIGFSSDKLYTTTGAAIGRVKYPTSLNFPKIKPSGPNNMNDLIVQSCTKPLDWQYEEEYRMIFWNGEAKRTISSDSIEEVIFGCNASDKSIQEIGNLIRSDKELHHIKLMKAKKHASQYKILLKADHI